LSIDENVRELILRIN